MDERSIKRLAVMVATAIVIILVLKYIGLRMAARVQMAHQKQVAVRQLQTPASTPAQGSQPQTGDETDALIVPGTDDAAGPSAPVAPLLPEAASAPTEPGAAPSATDPTVSTPPASLNSN